MKITRLGNDNGLDKDVDRIEITLNGRDYILSDRNGSLEIHACHDEILVRPVYANVIQVTGGEIVITEKETEL
jgi:hypothetical protein